MSEKLTIISDKLKGEGFELSGETIFIGRESSNDIVLKDSSVSRRHSLIEKRGEQFLISDLESLNGTFVNGKKAEHTPLTHGDKIVIGDFTLRFQTKEFLETSSTILFDQTELRLPKNSMQVRIEEVFGAMARDLIAILRISEKINTIRETEELQSELLRMIFEVIPADSGAILLVDGENEFVENVGLNRREQSCLIKVSQTIVNRVLIEKKVVLIADTASDESLKTADSVFLAGISSLLCAPLMIFGNSTGVIYLSTEIANFDESHLRFLTAIAGITAVAIENAKNFSRLKNENEFLRGENLSRNMIGESEAMKKVYSLIEKVAPTDSTVLITGESGTGKELAAQAVHINSKRNNAPFVAINCAALTETLLESELFGHEKGAFTGAVQQKKGKVELANGGTLFLDEIGEMNLNLQSKLLRVLQEREFERVGGNKPIKADIRLIAATNRDLPTEIKNGNFRQDLFYRLNVVQFSMPALRDRKEDILLLAEYFTQKFSRILNRKLRGLSAKTKKILLNYDFPGNVRELENTIERAVVLGSNEWILPEDLPEDLLELKMDNQLNEIANYHDGVREKKKDLIVNAFKQSNKSYVETAKLLDIHPNYLHRLVKNLDLKEELENDM